MLNKKSIPALLLAASALSALSACNAPVPGLQQAAMQQKQPAQAVVPAAQLENKQARPVLSRSEGAVVSDPAGSFAVTADFGSAAASNVADFTQSTADFTGADVNAFWASAEQGGLKERFAQRTEFGTHLINPTPDDLKTSQKQKPLLVNGDLAIGILGNNYQLAQPLSSRAQQELDFLLPTATEAKFVWASNAQTLRAIYLHMDNGELREVPGPFKMGSGLESVTPSNHRPLLQQLLESANTSVIGGGSSNLGVGTSSTGGVQNLGNYSVIAGGSHHNSGAVQNLGNTIVLGGGSQNSGTTQFLGEGVATGR